ncbi:PHAF1 protein CG7083 [Leptidea sinapis]|uniref:PHAF1 protein CG7083 n=1 Tax=Leptidea sinapis TaxID=189913 RepID=UPI00212388FC|nr:PHAF1 protein CG7083 [Leptidea sinapis]
MLDLEIIPERSLGSDAWEFVLGMHFSQAVAIIQSQVGTIRGVQVLYSDQSPLSVDLVINMPQDGVRLIFDPVAQRLKIIEIYNMKLVKLRYSGMCFNSPEITPSIEQVEHCFGATHPGLYDSQRHLFALNFRGLTFYFPVDSKFEPGYAHGLGSLQFPNGGSPVVSRTTIYYGSQHQLSRSGSGGRCQAPLAELPQSCYRHQLHLRRCDVIRSATATMGLRLHIYTENSRAGEAATSRRRVVLFGDTVQGVARSLAAPARLYYKADDKMRIHRPTARRRPPPASDYFFNYFTLGLDVLFDARTHRVKKFVLHTNYPGHYNFNMYHRCEFELNVQPDKCESSVVESRGPVSITAYSKWESVSRALRVCERPVVLNRASSTNTTNPFGSTFCYGYQDIIFEVMSNNYIASITLYQTEATRPHYTVNSIA